MILLNLFLGAYYLCALFYSLSGFILLFWPNFIHHHIPKLFPLLGHFKLERLTNAWNLILMGTFLFTIGFLMSGKSYWGFFLAMVISLWEVYLSIAFYHFHLRDKVQAVVHFIVHLFFALLLGYFILNNFNF